MDFWRGLYIAVYFVGTMVVQYFSLSFEYKKGNNSKFSILVYIAVCNETLQIMALPKFIGFGVRYDTKRIP